MVKKRIDYFKQIGYSEDEIKRLLKTQPTLAESCYHFDIAWKELIKAIKKSLKEDSK